MLIDQFSNYQKQRYNNPINFEGARISGVEYYKFDPNTFLQDIKKYRRMDVFGNSLEEKVNESFAEVLLVDTDKFSPKNVIKKTSELIRQIFTKNGLIDEKGNILFAPKRATVAVDEKVLPKVCADEIHMLDGDVKELDGDFVYMYNDAEAEHVKTQRDFIAVDHAHVRKAEVGRNAILHDSALVEDLTAQRLATCNNNLGFETSPRIVTAKIEEETDLHRDTIVGSLITKGRVLLSKNVQALYISPEAQVKRYTFNRDGGRF